MASHEEKIARHNDYFFSLKDELSFLDEDHPLRGYPGEFDRIINSCSGKDCLKKAKELFHKFNVDIHLYLFDDKINEIHEKWHKIVNDENGVFGGM